ncbi:MAG: sulfurtransferase TusA family protein [Candidatus Tectimicrobiota bacterium]
MEAVVHAPADIKPDEVCEGGNLDCGSGLLLLIRKAVNSVPDGGILEIRSTEISVREDLPAWCRMTKNPYLGWAPGESHNKYFVRKGGLVQAEAAVAEQQARAYRWQCRVRWSEGLQCKVYCRNHSWEVGQPASFDVQDVAPSAVEYVLGALGACLAMGFQIHASRRGIQVEALEIALSGQIENILVFLGIEQQGHSGFQSITGTLYVQADAEETLLDEIWQHTLAVSPVAMTLARPVTLDIALRQIF